MTRRRSRSSLNSNEGFRPCLRRDTRHTVDYQFCNCLRTELPVEARAKSSGALGTPERNHTCPDCTDGISSSRPPHPRFANFVCPRCAGSGELSSNGSPRHVAQNNGESNARSKHRDARSANHNRAPASDDARRKLLVRDQLERGGSVNRDVLVSGRPGVSGDPVSARAYGGKKLHGSRGVGHQPKRTRGVTARKKAPCSDGGSGSLRSDGSAGGRS